MNELIRTGYENRLKACEHVGHAAALLAAYLGIKASLPSGSGLLLQERWAFVFLLLAIAGSAMCHLLYGWTLTGLADIGKDFPESSKKQPTLILAAVVVGFFEWLFAAASAALIVTAGWLSAAHSVYAAIIAAMASAGFMGVLYLFRPKPG